MERVTEVWIVAHPRSRREAVRRVGDEIHVWVTAPPVADAANTAMIALLARTLGIARSRVTIVSGTQARRKHVRVAGLDAAAIHELIPQADGA